MFSLAYAEGADWNDSHFSHDRFNKLLIEARAELDDAKRSEMLLRDAEDPARRGRHHHTLLPQTSFYAHRGPNVKHDEKLSGNWALDGSRGAERWWFG